MCVVEKVTHEVIKLVDVGKEAQKLEVKRGEEEENRAVKDVICA